jgi:hypothetical protein
MAPLVEAMAEDVVWRGLLAELVCHGLDEVAGVVGSARAGHLPRVADMEAGERGDRVVPTVGGPGVLARGRRGSRSKR